MLNNPFVQILETMVSRLIQMDRILHVTVTSPFHTKTLLMCGIGRYSISNERFIELTATTGLSNLMVKLLEGNIDKSHWKETFKWLSDKSTNVNDTKDAQEIIDVITGVKQHRPPTYHNIVLTSIQGAATPQDIMDALAILLTHATVIDEVITINNNHPVLHEYFEIVNSYFNHLNVKSIKATIEASVILDGIHTTITAPIDCWKCEPRLGTCSLRIYSRLAVE